MSLPTVIEWANNRPVVYLPEGTKLSNKFTLEAGRPLTVKNLLTNGDQNTKLAKSNKKQKEFKTFGLSLAPATLAGVGNMCPHASPACKAHCLDGSGMRSVWESIHLGKIAKTIVFNSHRQWFLDRLAIELNNKQKAANKAGHRLAVRLNVLSDYPWETTGIIDAFPNIEFNGPPLTRYGPAIMRPWYSHRHWAGSLRNYLPRGKVSTLSTVTKRTYVS